MKKPLKEVIYQGVWEGLGRIFNIRIGNGYTTIIVKPGENLQQRLKETKEKYAGQT
jgi:hypothetical protein